MPRKCQWKSHAQIDSRTFTLTHHPQRFIRHSFSHLSHASSLCRHSRGRHKSLSQFRPSGLAHGFFVTMYLCYHCQGCSPHVARPCSAIVTFFPRLLHPYFFVPIASNRLHYISALSTSGFRYILTFSLTTHFETSLDSGRSVGETVLRAE